MAPLISCTQLLMRLGDEDVLVIMLQSRSDGGQRIPGALSMTLEDLARDSRVLPDDELIVLCAVEDERGEVERACDRLRQTHPRAVCLQGGARAWLDGGFPTEAERDDLGPQTVY